ncbi:YicC/YloC family endoribonuclease [Alteribacter natronophilus]|uniref:YicC/YloC family endoribonuclease n=1 Tax=Alteribacter natronophilus TaxID=2583810 RepID=UPI00110F3A42|nr:YicC/YloC family endoribonuclease [Alteribacter natronophilus]TMW73161.1 YicC family protein [Alteribacter natronophilus]
MIVSMTGYGRSVKEKAGYQVTVEMKTVNHRFCEMNIRMPRQFMGLEEKVKKTIGRYISRGKADVFITVEGESLVQRGLRVDWDLFHSYTEVFRQMKEKADEGGASLPLGTLLANEDVVTVEETDDLNEEAEHLLLEAVNEAADSLNSMRKAEGKELAADLKARASQMGLWSKELAAHAPLVKEHYQRRLEKKVTSFLEGKAEVDESRILTEVAVFSDKADIQEELTRIESHLKQMDAILDTGGVTGRKLDFLVQELNREFNTIGSKSNDLQISQRVVDLKAELEKVKEQVQNIE